LLEVENMKEMMMNLEEQLREFFLVFLCGGSAERRGKRERVRLSFVAWSVRISNDGNIEGMA